VPNRRRAAVAARALLAGPGTPIVVPPTNVRAVEAA
jgi:phytoene synthase